MRILFLTHQYFPRHIGGTEMLVRGLVRRLCERGDEAVVLTYVESASSHFSDFGFRVSEFEGAPLWELHCNLSAMQHPAEAEFHHPMLAELVARAVREIRPDIIHAAHVMKLSGAVLPKLKREGFPVVVTLSDFWPLCLRHTLLKPDQSLCETGPDNAQRCLTCAQSTHSIARPLVVCADEADLWQHAREATEDAAYPDASFRRDVLALARRKDSLRGALLTADRIFALSRFQREVFLQHGYPAERLEVLHHGVETQPLEQARAARRKGIPDGAAKKVVFIGTLAPHKGLHLLIESLRQVSDTTLRLEVIGGDGVDAGYARDLRELAMGDVRIIFRGEVPPESLGRVLQDATALALPALWFENDPLVVKAALYCGVPVAASRLGSLTELVSEDTGWLLPPGDVSAWVSWWRDLACAPVRIVPCEVSVPTADDFAEQMGLIYESFSR